MVAYSNCSWRGWSCLSSFCFLRASHSVVWFHIKHTFKRSYSSFYSFCCGLFSAWIKPGLSSKAASAELCSARFPHQSSWWCWLDAKYCSTVLLNFEQAEEQEAHCSVSSWESKNSWLHSSIAGWHLANCNHLDAAWSAEIALVDCSGLLTDWFTEEHC